MQNSFRFGRRRTRIGSSPGARRGPEPRVKIVVLILGLVLVFGWGLDRLPYGLEHLFGPACCRPRRWGGWGRWSWGWNTWSPRTWTACRRGPGRAGGGVAVAGGPAGGQGRKELAGVDARGAAGAELDQ